MKSSDESWRAHNATLRLDVSRLEAELACKYEVKERLLDAAECAEKYIRSLKGSIHMCSTAYRLLSIAIAKTKGDAK